jgi:hypothetical protein
MRRGAMLGSLLESGRWLGRGTLLPAGRSLGQAVECELQIESEDGAGVLTGTWREAGQPAVAFSLRVARNEEGTWTVGARAGALQLQGSAKLDSPPNLALLWNDAGNLYLTATLFAVDGGYGCRGFARDGERVSTWEVAFRLEQAVVGGPNVISLHRRR